MAENDSGKIAARSGGKREKTRFPGVYSRSITNKRTGKPDVAFDFCYRDELGKFSWQFIGYKSDGVNAVYASRKRGAILDGITKGEKPARKQQVVRMIFAESWAIFAEKWLPNIASPQDEHNIFIYKDNIGDWCFRVHYGALGVKRIEMKNGTEFRVTYDNMLYANSKKKFAKHVLEVCPN